MAIATLSVDIVAKLGNIERDMGKAAQIAQNNANKMQAAFESAGSKIKHVFAELATFVAGGEFLELVKGSIEAADHLEHLSKTTDIAVAALSGLRFAADVSGSNLDDIANSVNKLGVNIGKNAEKFEKLGITAKDPLEAFKQLADVFSHIEDPQLRAALAAETLGKSWQGAAPLLAQGADGIQALVDRGTDLAKTTEETALQAHKFDIEMNAIKTASQGVLIQGVGPLLPILTQVATAMAEAAKQGGILYAALIGLGTIGKITLFGDDESQTRQRLVAIKDEINDINKELAVGQKFTQDGGWVKFTNTDIQERIIQLKALGNEQANLQKKINPPKEEKADPATDAAATAKAAAFVHEQEFASARKKAEQEAQKDYDKRLEFFKKEQEDLAHLIEQTLKLNEGEKTQAQQLQDKLNAYESLDPAVRGYIQSQIDIAKTAEEAALQLDVMNAATDREIELANQVADAEKQASDERERVFNELSDKLLQGNEDLNASLITNDKQRAAAQIEIERQRAIDHVNSLILEGDEAQQLIDQINERANLQLKEAAKGGKSALHELTQAVEGFGKSSADAFVNFAFGAKSSFSDMVNSMLKDLARLVVYQGVFKPLFSGISDSISSGGFGDVLKSFLPSFAVGSNFVPQDMIAQIHKGERIVPAAENNGNHGMTNISVSVDASGSSVSGDSASAAQLGAAIAGAVRKELLNQKRGRGLLAA